MMESKKLEEKRIRPAAVAGMFYPGEGATLRSMLEQMLARAKTAEAAPKALIVPHAGYIYSGQAAADVYARLQNRQQPITKVVLLGPAHRVGFEGIAGSTADYFDTPLGRILLDRELLERAFQLEGVVPFDRAHAEEHSLEVQLPFLQTVLGDFTLAPFVVGDAPEDLTASLLEALWGGDETLIVISSDLSHYLDYASAQQRDSHTAHNIETFHGERIGPHDACGYGGIRGLLRVAQHKGMAVERVTLCNSGDTAGDKRRVVGYASYALH
jgi:hypothetical protein